MIQKPIISEKSMRLATEQVYMFEVSIDSNKKTIANDIESLYGVKPSAVRVQKRIGKSKRVLRAKKTRQTKTRKFAYVVVPKGKSIPGFDKVLEVDETENNES
ncbi:50S ribosomal protein L23 [candidate division WWE3 bacterium CG_4_9_14_3_um_filter_41_6]|uniref:50S ribosomal protein L23 n=1 Tax=candidate division WWE3 bacterium CG_4_10_14_0_2_um_filter_41_14 TaxID=1975072 RepID=A0A2M7TFV9_UNCKA|nr:MAG: 50S ribosomal protein L23 [candidate division WWE3 bacterium CG_4_10_14_0_2_um_filter_41_14]PJA39237.1 MAG: 50S ribosomal protein L23 [candidate division WWE3 bacterium CG_4_9_14_3_um_filter_41_6]